MVVPPGLGPLAPSHLSCMSVAWPGSQVYLHVDFHPGLPPGVAEASQGSESRSCSHSGLNFSVNSPSFPIFCGRTSPDSRRETTPLVLEEERVLHPSSNHQSAPLPPPPPPPPPATASHSPAPISSPDGNSLGLKVQGLVTGSSQDALRLLRCSSRDHKLKMSYQRPQHTSYNSKAEAVRQYTLPSKIGVRGW